GPRGDPCRGWGRRVGPVARAGGWLCVTESVARLALACNSNYMRTGKQDEPASPQEQIRGWFTGRGPDDWVVGEPEVVVDREEMRIMGRLPSPGAPTGAATAAGGGDAAGPADDAGAAAAPEGGAEAGAEGAGAGAAAIGRSRRFREETRDARVEIARE